MKAQFEQLAQKFDALSQRERGLIAIALLALIAMLAYMPIESLWKQQHSTAQQLKVIEQENQVSVQQIDLYQQRLALDPNQDYRQRLILLQQQTNSLILSLTSRWSIWCPPIICLNYWVICLGRFRNYLTEVYLCRARTTACGG